jgi:hypothetical protein
VNILLPTTNGTLISGEKLAFQVSSKFKVNQLIAAHYLEKSYRVQFTTINT